MEEPVYERLDKIKDRYDAYFWENKYGGAGYVGVPKGHPFYEVDLSEVHDLVLTNEQEKLWLGLDVHGGITWSQQGDGTRDGGMENPDLWYIGWDAMHHANMAERYMKRWYGEPVTTEMLRTETQKLLDALYFQEEG